MNETQTGPNDATYSWINVNVCPSLGLGCEFGESNAIRGHEYVTGLLESIMEFCGDIEASHGDIL
jgi:hypothetical protein